MVNYPPEGSCHLGISRASYACDPLRRIDGSTAWIYENRRRHVEPVCRDTADPHPISHHSQELTLLVEDLVCLVALIPHDRRSIARDYVRRRGLEFTRPFPPRSKLANEASEGVEYQDPQFRAKRVASAIEHIEVASSVEAQATHPVEHLPRLALKSAYLIHFLKVTGDESVVASQSDDLLGLGGRRRYCQPNGVGDD